MAPKAEASEDFNFIMTCVKHLEGDFKPNLEKVAEEIGAKSGSACYHRLWRIKKDWGLTGSGGNKKGASPAGQKRKTATKANGDDGGSNKEPSPKKKPRNSKAQATEAIKKEADVENEEDEVENEKSPASTPEEN
ncbi:hypothetical protein LTR10_013440 [Elasticomyces elasticus]|uniref:Myb-like DNA-binding domain-containing protein n=1 Tax=Exophiala sideris TaxID=1016849 RepID=A0ABR0J4U8_9EURO|nr:hypothetical protein LTR10_013440 [Elasticomyces elasticus]KAK5027330.1 hypothetical protein LTS07_006932 [Exophiala sideris]KAK5034968.1 hypothetical protein LTR13_006150 [Exophiala sideris]KAK5056298.1 hypothetical protein LTR69_007839 [Exophiala sideris]KAK5181213.1 hypothetical protein LTR44_006544 [Eurotiomycetes sp. CCFEE 6388]